MIRVENLIRYRGTEPVLQGVTAEFPQGITVLMGPSGGGKTTLLRILAGLESPDGGTIRGGEEKRCVFLFQEPRLLPWATAEQNIRLVQEEHPERTAAEWLRAVGLAGSENKLPGELSGGMCQRAALARAFARGGDLWLLDEPFKEIDQQNRQQLYTLLQQETAGKTVLLVTHDFQEARQLSSRILWLEHGKLSFFGAEQEKSFSF